MKTLAIRLEEEQHAQLTMIAQLEEVTVTDAIRQAIETWVNERRNNPQLKARAEAVLAAIEKEANTRKGAIAALLSGEASAPVRDISQGKPSGRGPRRGGGTS